MHRVANGLHRVFDDGPNLRRAGSQDLVDDQERAVCVTAIAQALHVPGRRNQHTVRTDTHRLILHKDGYTELYDHTTEAGETVNVSEDQPDQAKALGLLIKEQFGK